MTTDLSTLTDDQLLARLRESNAEWRSRTHAGLLAYLRTLDVIQIERVVGVSFAPNEWENGWFFDAAEAVIIRSDGTSEIVDLCDDGRLDALVSRASDVHGPLVGADRLHLDLINDTVSTN